jgi:hypothetical protein
METRKCLGKLQPSRHAALGERHGAHVLTAFFAARPLAPGSSPSGEAEEEQAIEMLYIIVYSRAHWLSDGLGCEMAGKSRILPPRFVHFPFTVRLAAAAAS